MTCTIVFIEQGAVHRQKRSIITSTITNVVVAEVIFVPLSDMTQIGCYPFGISQLC